MIILNQYNMEVAILKNLMNFVACKYLDKCDEKGTLTLTYSYSYLLNLPENIYLHVGNDTCNSYNHFYSRFCRCSFYSKMMEFNLEQNTDNLENIITRKKQIISLVWRCTPKRVNWKRMRDYWRQFSWEKHKHWMCFQSTTWTKTWKAKKGTKGWT